MISFTYFFSEIKVDIPSFLRLPLLKEPGPLFFLASPNLSSMLIYNKRSKYNWGSLRHGRKLPNETVDYKFICLLQLLLSIILKSMPLSVLNLFLMVFFIFVYKPSQEMAYRGRGKVNQNPY